MAKSTSSRRDQAAGFTSFTSKLLLSNVVWPNRPHTGLKVPPFVGLGVCKNGQKFVTADQYNQSGRQHNTAPTPQRKAYSSCLVLTRAGASTALHGTDVYFSVSTHGYDCPQAPVLTDDDDQKRMPHYVWKYDSITEECSTTIKPVDVHDFGIAVVKEQLVVVGGETDQQKIRDERVSSTPDEKFTLVSANVSPRIAVLDLNEARNGWQDSIFPAMSKPRKQPAVIYMKQYLVVAGGVLDDKLLSGSVEVLNTESKVWSPVTSLPEALRSLTTAHCGNQLYFLGGIGKNGSSCSVFTCPVESIKEFCDGSSERVVWQKACDTPLFRSSSVVYNDELYAVGGRTSTYRPSSDIYCYDSSIDSWNLVDQQLPTPRSLLIAAATKNKLVVIGGLVQSDEPTDIIEVGTCLSGM